MSVVSAVHVPSPASMVDRMAVSALSAPVLLVAAFGFFVAMSVWCFQRGKGTFSGNWHWSQHGTSIFIECR